MEDWFAMENMIKRIVEMDERARQITEEAQHAKVDSSVNMEEKRRDMREDYLQRARERIKKNEIEEQKQADEEWKVIHEKYLRMEKTLDETVSKKKEEWARQLVERVIGG